MLVDASHPEETRVAIVNNNALEDFDFEKTHKKQLKGNIYLAKVIRIEPSLQAAFVEYGGNRHGFLPFDEIHHDYFRIPVADRDSEDELPEEDEEVSEEEKSFEAAAHEHVDVAAEESVAEPVVEPPHEESAKETNLSLDYDVNTGLITDFGNAVVEPLFDNGKMEDIQYSAREETAEWRREKHGRINREHKYKIQEVIKRRQVMLVQVVKEERGNKGATISTFLSLAGRYCVLMPNTDGHGGVSRKITSHQDRRRMKEVLDKLETPEGMAVILRTAGMEQEPQEIQRDLENLLKLWNGIREQTLASTAPSLIYEEADLIKRSLRDLYTANVEEILVAGKQGFDKAKEFAKSIMPDAEQKIKLYEDSVPLSMKYNVEKQIDQLYNPIVQLKSGGYIVINPTEALVSIDVNSGRATKERHIESTALKTNLEAVDEIARQLRLRDLAGLIVVDFIDMDDGRNNSAVERRMKEAMKQDRARIQISRLSMFGLMEISRQRLRPSLTEINFEKCVHCAGMGMVRTVDSRAIFALRQIEEECIAKAGNDLIVQLPTSVAMYILNQKRTQLCGIEQKYGVSVFLRGDDSTATGDVKIERVKSWARGEDTALQDSEEEHEHKEEGAPEKTPKGRMVKGRRGKFVRGKGRAAPAEEKASIAEDDVLADIEDNIGNAAVGMAPAKSQDTERRGKRNIRSPNRGRRSFGGKRVRSIDNEAKPFAAEAVETENKPQNVEEKPEANKNNGRNKRHNSDDRFYSGMSIHDIDTTPKDYKSESVKDYKNVLSDKEISARSKAIRSPYEINPEVDKPKGGWWKKLTGQD